MGLPPVTSQQEVEINGYQQHDPRHDARHVPTEYHAQQNSPRQDARNGHIQARRLRNTGTAQQDIPMFDTATQHRLTRLGHRVAPQTLLSLAELALKEDRKSTRLNSSH